MHDQMTDRKSPLAEARTSDLSHAAIRDALANLASAGGPTPQDYPRMRDLMDMISHLRSAGDISDLDHNGLWRSIGAAGTKESLMGFIYHKPHGYHGDFEIINKFYTHHVNSDPNSEGWDRWVQNLEAVRAVRNRKDFLISLLRQASRVGGVIKLLNVGSGPCRDILEALEQLRGTMHLNATCVDVDQNAIAYGRSLLKGYEDRIEFVQQNVLRLRRYNEFDIAWSAGLFDYLNDRLFVAALKRMYNSVKPEGMVIIGNFSPTDPSRSALEWGNWRLIYRAPAELLRLAAELGISEDAATVESEPLGVNLFLKIRKT